jgi:hypothetical protein
MKDYYAISPSDDAIKTDYPMLFDSEENVNPLVNRYKVGNELKTKAVIDENGNIITPATYTNRVLWNFRVVDGNVIEQVDLVEPLNGTVFVNPLTPNCIWF